MVDAKSIGEDKTMPQNKAASGGGGGPPAPPVVLAKRRVARHAKAKFVGQTAIADTTHVVRYNEVEQTVADSVFVNALEAWGFGDADDATRTEILAALAKALVIATSKDEENLSTKFYVGSKYLEVRVIHDLMAEAVPDKDSHLRVFARSYDGGALAARMFDIMNDPGNIELRMEMSMRCGGIPLAYTPYAIDVFDALVRHSGRDFTPHELSLHYRYKNFRAGQATASANAAGLPAARNDVSTRVDKQMDAPAVRAPPPPAASGRLSFAAVRA